jgi:DNA-directed RNA polymerase delta subunit
MKLISMTDFVLEQNKEPYFYYDSLWNKVIAYANFLKQPLTLGMFVPCDSNGNVVKKP